MSVIPFEPGASLARISATPSGWIIDCWGPRAAQHYDFRSEGEAAEMAMTLRDEGGWRLRFSPSADIVRKLVDELSEGGAHA